MCWPEKLPSRDSGSTSPSVRTRAFGSSRRALEEKASIVPMPPSMSTQPSARVAPVRKLSA
jgi:hypothetical protein